MARCPNCGREAIRTEDWCCQWCGYPLLSGSYKKIPKSYRELREERIPQQSVLEEVKPETTPVLEAELEPVSELGLEPVLETEPEAVPEPISEPEPTAKPKAMAKRKPATKSKSAPKTTAEAKPTVRRKRATKAKAATEPEPVLETEPKVVPEPISEPEPAPAAVEITVTEFLSAYEGDGEAANAKFTNQVLRIKGLVDRIEVKESLDIYYITLNSAEKKLLLQGVRCVFDKKHGSELTQLTEGQTVTVQGKYEGSIIDLSLRDCVLVR